MTHALLGGPGGGGPECTCMGWLQEMQSRQLRTLNQQVVISCSGRWKLK